MSVTLSSLASVVVRSAVGRTALTLLCVALPSLAAAQTGVINGRVTTGAGATPLAGVTVVLSTHTGAFVQAVVTDGGGNYSFTALADGTYKARTNLASVSTEGPEYDFVDELYNNVPCPGFCDVQNSGLALVITPGNSITADFDLAPAAVVTGTITAAAGGGGLNDVGVEAYASTTPFPLSGSVYSDGTGAYRLRLPPGTYYLKTVNDQRFVDRLHSGVSCGSGCPFSSGTAVTIAAGAPPANINFALDAGGDISGMVLGPGSVPVANVTVEVYSGTVLVATGRTLANGTYVTGALPGGAYRVRTRDANAQGFVNVIYPGLTCVGPPGPANPYCNVSFGNAVTVNVGASTPNINFNVVVGATISGHVTSGGATPIPSLTMSLHTSSGVLLATTTTNSTGDYSFTALPNRPYKVRTNVSSTQDFLDEVFNNISCNPVCNLAFAGTVINTVAPNTSTADFDLAAAAVVSGTVTNASGGAALAGVTVSAHSTAPPNTLVRSTTTDANGVYRLQLSPGGNFYVRTSGPSYINQIHSGISCGLGCSFTTATAVTPAIGAPATVDFALVQAGTASGFVRTAGGAPLQNVTVEFYTGSSALVTSAVSQADGSYSAGGFSTGTFFARTQGAEAGGNVNGIYAADNCLGFAGTPSCNVAAGTPIAINTGANTPNVNFALAQGGSITGTVTNASTTAAVTAGSVSIFDNNGNQVRVANLSMTGTYTAPGLPTGDYRARTSNFAGLIDELHTDRPCLGNCDLSVGELIHVAAPAATTVNFALAPGARISGRITDLDGNGLNQTGGQMSVQVWNTAGQLLGILFTDNTGNYLTHGLTAGSYYLVTSNTKGFLNKIYNSGATNGGVTCGATCTIEDGTLITLADGEQRGGINLTLDRGGRILGRVTRSDNNTGVANVTVQVIVPGVPAGTTTVATAVTDNNGNYVAIGALPTGNYWLKTVNSVGLINEIYNDILCLGFCNALDGDPVAVVAGVDSVGVDFVLDVGGRIAGTVSDNNGNGLPGVMVSIVDSTGTTITSPTTDGQGNYSTSVGLPTGKDYFARTSNSLGLIDEIHSNIQCAGFCAAQTGTAISVPDTTPVDVDFVLAAGGRIGGTVVEAGTLTPIPNVTVTIYNAAGSTVATARTNGLGQYQTAGGLPLGTRYFARTSNSLGYLNVLYAGRVCQGTCSVTTGTPIEITQANPQGEANFTLTTGGRIAGIVTNNTGAPLANVTVRIVTNANQQVSFAVTNSAGQYITLDGLATGTYFATTSNTAGYLDERYNVPLGIRCGNNCAPGFGSPIVVTSPATTNGVDFVLEPGGRVSGRVTDDAEPPVALRGVNVNIIAAGGGTVGFAFTDANGNYLSPALPDGSYYAQTFNSAGYIDRRSATFDVVGPAVTPDINLTLSQGARISGRVTDSAGNGIAGVSVSIADSSNFFVASAITGSTGSYTIGRGLPRGIYFARTSNLVGYIDKQFDNITCPSCAPNTATPIDLTAGGSRTDIDFELVTGGRISGVVTDVDGDPISAVTVVAFSLDGRSSRSARTDDTGRYEIVGLAGGSYFVRTSNLLAYLDQIHSGLECDYGAICPITSGTQVPVTVGVVTPNINFSLRIGGRITGLITNAGGTGIIAARVSIFDRLGRMVNLAVTDGAGRYVTGTGLPAGTYFAVAAGDGYMRERYNNQSCSPSCAVTEGTAITVTAGTSTANIDFTLEPGARIAGRVTEAETGRPLSNVSVLVGLPSLTQASSVTGQSSSVIVSSGVTDGAGYYITRDGLAAERSPGNPYQYTLHALNVAGRINELYDNVPCVELVTDRCVGGTAVTVTGTNTSIDKNFALALGGRIRGRVTDSTGRAIAGLTVAIWNVAGRPITNASVFTDAEGNFETPTGLPDGTYFVSTRNGLAYVDEVWVNDTRDNTCVSSRCDVTRGSPVVITNGASVGNIDFSLAVGGRVAGRVRGRTSAGQINDLPNVTVEIYGNTGIFLTSLLTDSTGRFEILSGLPTGTFFVKTVNSLGYTDELYDNFLCQSCVVTTGTPVTVTAGTTTQLNDIELGQGGSLGGSVFAVTGSGASSAIDRTNAEIALADMPVIILQCPDGARTCATTELRIVARTRTNADGVYTVSVPPGVYFVQTDAFPGYTMAIYRAPSQPDGPTPVQPCARGLCDPNLGSPIDMAFGSSVGRINIGVNTCGAVTVNPILLPLFSPGTPYSQTITATGGVAPYGFAVIQGELPPGLTLNGTSGVVSGASTVAGSTAFTISATDANGCSGTRDYNPTICAVALGASTLTVGSGAGAGVLAIVAASGDCPWTVSSNATWLTAEVNSGNGSIGLNFTYQDRGAFSQPRTGTIRVGANTFAVTQNGVAPIYTVSPEVALVGPGSAGGVLQVVTNTVDAAWTATTNVSWITIASATGTGTGSASFTVARNPTTAARVGSIFVGGQIATITQRANGIPGDPQGLGARVQSGRARFDWAPSIEGGDATSYALEAGLAPGSTAITFTTPDGQPTLEIPPTVPPGRYYFRVKGRNEFGTGNASEEYELVVGADGTNPPGPPLNVTMSLAGARLTVTWDAPSTGGPVSGYVLEAGSGSMRTDIAVLSLGTSRTFTYDGVPPGNFFLRVRAMNGAGLGEASPELLLNAGGVASPPGPPRSFAATVSGSTLAFTWLAPNVGGAPTSYVLEAGSARGLSNIAVFNTGSTATTISFNNVPAGVYYVRLRAQNGAGIGTTSNEVRVVVP